MVGRITKTFAAGHVYAAYVMAGDGGIENTINMAFALIKGGANLLEIGIPFSDPVADGPVIQAAATRSLSNATTLADVFSIVRKIRAKTNVPIVLMSYFNPIFQYSVARFLADAKDAGVDGLLTVDLPLEKLLIFQPDFIAQQIDPILLIAPNTSAERIKKIAACGSGFLYYACRRGTTGVRSSLPEDFAEKITEIKKYTDLPILVGFGISSAEMVQEVLQHAEGLVVASHFVQAIAAGATPEAMTHCAQKLFQQESLL
jgi:tryptophan synthase alpha chain